MSYKWFAIYEPTKCLRIDGKTILISEYYNIIIIFIERRGRINYRLKEFVLYLTVCRFNRHINRLIAKTKTENSFQRRERTCDITSTLYFMISRIAANDDCQHFPV